jgi:hypothetical protein
VPAEDPTGGQRLARRGYELVHVLQRLPRSLCGVGPAGGARISDKR